MSKSPQTMREGMGHNLILYDFKVREVEV